MRGALACMLPWRLGSLPGFPPEGVEQADLADRDDRRIERRVGVAPGAGILFFRGRGSSIVRVYCLSVFDCVLLLWQY